MIQTLDFEILRHGKSGDSFEECAAFTDGVVETSDRAFLELVGGGRRNCIVADSWGCREFAVRAADRFGCPFPVRGPRTLSVDGT